MTAIKPSSSAAAASASTDSSRRSRGHPLSPINHYPPSSASSSLPPPSSSSSSLPPPTHSHLHSHNNISSSPSNNNNENSNPNIHISSISNNSNNHPHSTTTTTTATTTTTGQDYRPRFHRQSLIHSRNSRTIHRSHTRRHSASAQYAGPAEQDRVIRTANAHAATAAAGILSPRRRLSHLLLSPRGPQPQRHPQQQQQRHQHRQQHHKEQTTLRGTISPSSSVSLVSPLIVPRPSSMPPAHNRPLARQDQDEAAIGQPQPIFFPRPHVRAHQQQQQQQQQDKPDDIPPPDAYEIHKRLLQLQEQQQHRAKQREQRQMQQDRLLRAFSEPHGGLGYRRSSAVKEGFEEQWGNQIGEDQEEEDVAQSRPAAGDLRREEDEYDHTRRVRRQKQRQQQEQEEMMETDSFMDTDKNGDGDGDEDMNPHTKLQLARKAKEDAIRSYQEAGRTLQRAQEREEAILFEYEAEMFEVDVESSASQQHLRHGHGSHQPSQMFDHGHAYERARRSSPASAAAAAAAVTFQIQDDNNNEAMLRSRIVPQVSDTPSNYSETPRPHTIDFLPSRVMAPPPSSPPPVPSESVISDNIDHHHQQRQGLTPFMTTGTQVPNQTRGSSQVRSRSQSKGNEDAFSSHVQHDPISPCVKIKSEEHDELLFKKQLPNVGEYQPDETTQRPGPRYKDYNVPIEIPSSVGSDVGMGTGQPESSGAAQRRGERGGKARAVPDRWRAPTPVPPSIQARRGGGRQQGSARDSRPILGVRPGAFKVVPVDLLGDRAYSQQPQASSSRPVLLSPRSFVPRPRPYPPPPPVAQGRGQVQSNAPGGGGAGRGFPPNFFARGTPARPPPPPPPPAPQQRRGPVGVAPMAAASTGSPTAAAAPSPMPGYSSSTSSPRMPWQFPDFVDENGYPYPAVFFYTHIERVDHFYHQHHPMSISSRDTSLSPRHRASPNFFASHAGGGGGGGGGMEDVLEYEDMAMDGDVQPGRPRSRSQRRAQGSDDVGEEGERKPTAKAESPLF